MPEMSDPAPTLLRVVHYRYRCCAVVPGLDKAGQPRVCGKIYRNRWVARSWEKGNTETSDGLCRQHAPDDEEDQP